MEVNKNTEDKESKFLQRMISSAIITIIGYQYYDKFKKFIDSIRFKVEIVNTNNEQLSTYISSLAALGIPYRIKNIELIANNRVWKVQNCDIQNRIVANSQIPISFSAISNNLKEKPTNQIMAVTYSFCGFSFKRAYEPIITQKKPHSMAQSRASEFQKSKSCSCR
ncbi:hypothetical protein PL373_05805 [Tenacibaculum maritimum]|nr:hypothetical protein [Tenacibaculum maritimum]MDB0600666.1 hypothetical protein [Tenacibaculum maritimum]MDB0612649.1 hypothetical protein [Tenacibaculum maritimum]